MVEEQNDSKQISQNEVSRTYEIIFISCYILYCCRAIVSCSSLSIKYVLLGQAIDQTRSNIHNDNDKNQTNFINNIQRKEFRFLVVLPLVERYLSILALPAETVLLFMMIIDGTKNPPNLTYI